MYVRTFMYIRYGILYAVCGIKYWYGTYRQTDRHADTQTRRNTDILTYRHTDIQTDRQRERERERQTD